MMRIILNLRQQTKYHRRIEFHLHQCEDAGSGILWRRADMPRRVVDDEKSVMGLARLDKRDRLCRILLRIPNGRQLNVTLRLS